MGLRSDDEAGWNYDPYEGNRYRQEIKRLSDELAKANAELVAARKMIAEFRKQDVAMTKPARELLAEYDALTKAQP